jgi:hypothetical protein
MEGGRRRGQLHRVAETPVGVVERHVGGRDHQRNVYLAFKKPNLRTLRKSATNIGSTAANVNGTVEKPKH